MNWLDNALDYGISEFDFWNMTLAEIKRQLDSKKRVMKIQKQNEAYADYTLAVLIGRSYARIHSSRNKFPQLNEAYPHLFEEEEKNNDDISVMRFIAFANSFNKRIGGGKVKDERKT